MTHEEKLQRVKDMASKRIEEFCRCNAKPYQLLLALDIVKDPRIAEEIVAYLEEALRPSESQEALLGAVGAMIRR